MLTPVVSTSRPVSLRVLLPKEHGLWCWVSAPLLAALLLVPTAGSGLAVTSVFALFGAGNAARARSGSVAGAALAAGAALGLAAVPLLSAPRVWLLALGALVVGGAVALETAGRAVGRKVRGHTAHELATIGGFAAIGAAIAGASGAPVHATLAVGLFLVTWQVTGLWWVRRALAPVLPAHEPWAAGPPVVAALVVGTAATSILLGLTLLAPLPALYGVRVGLTRPVASGRDARRVGLSEALWAVGATLVAVLVVRSGG